MIDIVSVSHAMPWQHVLGAVILLAAGVVVGGFALVKALYPVPMDAREDGSDV